MKRSVAVLGRTPMFVRWAIERSCELREIFPERLPETTFRQLRAVREISLAIRQGRVREGICLHPTAPHAPVEDVFGFPVADVTDLFGGTAKIAACCRDCPANVGDQTAGETWAGCYGLLAADLRFDLERLTRGELSFLDDQHPGPVPTVQAGGWFDLPWLMEHAHRWTPRNASLNEPPDACGFQASPDWFDLWQPSQPSAGQLKQTELALEKVVSFLQNRFTEVASGGSLESFRAANPPKNILQNDLMRLLEAVKRCHVHALKMHWELVPEGYSDGRTWRLLPHCQICKRMWPDRTQFCRGCGNSGRYQNEIKLKVLGVRPYLQLVHILGIAEVKRIAES